MPIGEYFKGGGEKVMSNMTKEYGAKKGKQVFYATANKKGMNRPGKGGAGPSKKKSDEMIKLHSRKR